MTSSFTGSLQKKIFFPGKKSLSCNSLPQRSIMQKNEETLSSVNDQVFSESLDKQTGEKRKRFDILVDSDLDNLIDGAKAKSTKYATTYAVTVYEEWSSERKLTKKLHEYSDEELNEILRVFYAEVRNREGKDYSKSTLLGLRNGIERHLNGPPHHRGIQFCSNPAFKKSNLMLDAKVKNLKQQGKENVQHKPAITAQDLQKLKVCHTFSPLIPLGLLRNVWFHVSLYWCRRGREGQRSLTAQSFKFAIDEEGKEYATMAHDEVSKNHQGGLQDVPSFEKEGRMYRTDQLNDGYEALRLYLTKLNPSCTAFFQTPKRNWSSPAEDVWYENRPLGVNKLGSMMKEISKAAALSQVYTNHCVRATAITLWSNAGLPNRHIMAISGHRNEQSLKSYNARPSSGQLKLCSDVISQAFTPSGQASSQIESFHFSEPDASRNRPGRSFVQSSAVSSSSHQQQLNQYGGMFSGCSIGSIQVVFNNTSDK